MRRLAGALTILLILTTSAARGALIERSVELDLLELGLPSAGFLTTIDFEDVTLGPHGADSLVLDIHFRNGVLDVSSDPALFPSFIVGFEGSEPFSFLCCTTPTLLATNGNVTSDTLLLFEPGGLFLLDRGDGGFLDDADFQYGGLRVEASFDIPTSSTVTSLSFGQSFLNPIGATGDAYIESVPEPGAFSLLAAGILCAALAARGRRTANAGR